MSNFIQLCKQIPWRDYHTLTFLSPLPSSLFSPTGLGAVTVVWFWPPHGQALQLWSSHADPPRDKPLWGGNGLSFSFEIPTISVEIKKCSKGK